MAQKVSIILVDDIDGGDASETVQFGLDGTSYEIDLSDKNAGALRDALSGYVGHARKVGSGRRTRRASSCRHFGRQRQGGAGLGARQPAHRARPRSHPGRGARGVRRRALSTRPSGTKMVRGERCVRSQRTILLCLAGTRRLDRELDSLTRNS